MPGLTLRAIDLGDAPQLAAAIGHLENPVAALSDQNLAARTPRPADIGVYSAERLRNPAGHEHLHQPVGRGVGDPTPIGRPERRTCSGRSFQITGFGAVEIAHIEPPSRRERDPCARRRKTQARDVGWSGRRNHEPHLRVLPRTPYAHERHPHQTGCGGDPPASWEFRPPRNARPAVGRRLRRRQQFQRSLQITRGLPAFAG